MLVKQTVADLTAAEIGFAVAKRFVHYDIRRFFDFISSYDGEWYNWMECIDLYEEYCTPRS